MKRNQVSPEPLNYDTHDAQTNTKAFENVDHDRNLHVFCKSLKSTKLIVRLIGDYSENEENRKKVYNIRYFLTLLFKLLIKEECGYVVRSDGGHDKLYQCVASVTHSAFPHYKRVTELTDCNEETLRKTNLAKECIVLCHGTRYNYKEIKELIEDDKVIILLKGTGGLADVLAYTEENIRPNSKSEVIKKYLERCDRGEHDMSSKWKFKGLQFNDSLTKISAGKCNQRKAPEMMFANIVLIVFEKIIQEIITRRQKKGRNFQVVDTNKTLDQHKISHALLTAINEKGNGTGDIKDFLLLCIRLNNLEFAIQYGELWKVPERGKDDTTARDVIKYALHLERYTFLRYLVEHNIKLTDFIELKDISKNMTQTQERETWIDHSMIEKCKHVLSFGVYRQSISKRKQARESIKEFYCTGRSKEGVTENVYNENDETLNDLFTEAIYHEQFKLAFIIWKCLKKPTIAALYAGEMLNEMKSLVDHEDVRHIEKLNAQIKQYEELALETLNKIYEHYDLENSFCLLTETAEEWHGSSCINLAIKNNFGKFLSQVPCIKLNNNLWRFGSILGQIDEERLYPVCCTSCCLATRNKEESKEKEIPTEDVGKVRIKRIRYFLSPSILALLLAISQACFLILYAIWLVTILVVDSFHWIEWLLWIWNVFHIFELANQMIRNPMRQLVTTLFDYVEALAILMFLASWSLRVIAFSYPENEKCMDWARILFSIDYILFSILTLEYCYTNRFLGPKLIIVLKMAQVLGQFLLIILAFFCAFAVAAQAVLYPNSQMRPYLAFYILKRPFWSAFGEFALDELDTATSDCTNDPDLYNTYSKLRCPSESGSYYVPILMGVYVIIVNILLFNLLIALFNNDITRIEKRPDELWHYQTILFTYKLSKLIILPPPFIFLTPLLYYCRTTEKLQPFGEREIPAVQNRSQLRHIEAEQRDRCYNDIIKIKSPTLPPFNVDCPHKDFPFLLASENNSKMPKNSVDVVNLPVLEKKTQTMSTAIDKSTMTDSKMTGNKNTMTDSEIPSSPQAPTNESNGLWKTLHGQVNIRSVSQRANAILNKQEGQESPKKFFAVQTVFGDGTRWAIKGLKLKRKGHKKVVWTNGQSPRNYGPQTYVPKHITSDYTDKFQ